MVKKLVMNGTITCIYHDHTGNMGELAGFTKPAKAYSTLYVKVGRKELAIIRPDGARFNWKGQGEVRSGDRIRITLEIVKKKRVR